MWVFTVRKVLLKETPFPNGILVGDAVTKTTESLSVYLWLATTNTEEKDKNYCQNGNLKQKYVVYCHNAKQILPPEW